MVMVAASCLAAFGGTFEHRSDAVERDPKRVMEHESDETGLPWTYLDAVPDP